MWQQKTNTSIKHWDLDKSSQCLRGAFDLLLCSRKLNQSLTNPEVLTMQEQHNTTFTATLYCQRMCQCERAIYLPVINSGVFCYSPEGFYTGGSPGVVFWRAPTSSLWTVVPVLVSCHESHFYSPFFWWEVGGGACMLTKSMDKKKLWSLGCCNSVPFVTLRDFYTLHLHFGRTTSPWKIHHCLRVFPHVQNAAGQNSVASWSFWNDFGRTSRLTGVNISALEMGPDCIWPWREMVLRAWVPP